MEEDELNTKGLKKFSSANFDENEENGRRRVKY